MILSLFSLLVYSIWSKANIKARGCLNSIIGQEPYCPKVDEKGLWPWSRPTRSFYYLNICSSNGRTFFVDISYTILFAKGVTQERILYVSLLTNTLILLTVVFNNNVRIKLWKMLFSENTFRFVILKSLPKAVVI